MIATSIDFKLKRICQIAVAGLILINLGCAKETGGSKTLAAAPQTSFSDGQKPPDSFWNKKITCAHQSGRNNLYTITSLRFDGTVMIAVLDIKYAHFNNPWSDYPTITLNCTVKGDLGASAVLCNSNDPINKTVLPVPPAQIWLSRNKIGEVSVATDIPSGGENLGDSFNGCQ